LGGGRLASHPGSEPGEKKDRTVNGWEILGMRGNSLKLTRKGGKRGEEPPYFSPLHRPKPLCPMGGKNSFLLRRKKKGFFWGGKKKPCHRAYSRGPTVLVRLERRASLLPRRSKGGSLHRPEAKEEKTSIALAYLLVVFTGPFLFCGTGGGGKREIIMALAGKKKRADHGRAMSF